MLDLDKCRPRPAGGQGDCRRCRGDVAATSGDVAETLPQLGESASLFHVRLFQSPAGLGDISVKSPSVAATSIAETNFVRDWGDVSKTCWRPRRLPKMSQRHRHDCRRCCGDVAVTARDVVETLPQLRRRLGDVAVTAGDVVETSLRLPGKLVVTLSCLGTSLGRLLGESLFSCLILILIFFFLPVSSRSRKHLCEISISCGDVAHGD